MISFIPTYQDNPFLYIPSLKVRIDTEKNQITEFESDDCPNGSISDDIAQEAIKLLEAKKNLSKRKLIIEITDLGKKILDDINTPNFTEKMRGISFGENEVFIPGEKKIIIRLKHQSASVDQIIYRTKESKKGKEVFISDYLVNQAYEILEAHEKRLREQREINEKIKTLCETIADHLEKQPRPLPT